jgi:2-polyprenyl-6-hydroxyphenyl methylase / 3-demethylubiquinone-9 3-methyltransferase
MAAPRATSNADYHGTSAAVDEVARFAALAEDWWDEEGPFKPLHRMNPIRLTFIRDSLCGHFGRDARSIKPFKGLKVLDVGCGGGLLCEPLSRLGASVTGIEAAAESIAVAQSHARDMGLDIAYRTGVPEDLAATGETFDALINMEVIEHVADVDAFLAACCALVRPGGIMVLSTLNRTWRSLALGKIAAEYILGWVPPGTHDWRHFVRPSEMARGLRRHAMDMTALRGMSYVPGADEWRLSNNIDVNYLAMAVKR